MYIHLVSHIILDEVRIRLCVASCKFQIYLKSRLNCLLLSEDWIQDENDEELAKSRKRKSQNTELDDGNSDTEGDSIWEKLQVVTDKGEKGPKSAPKEDKPSKDVLPKVHQQKSKSKSDLAENLSFDRTYHFALMNILLSSITK